MNPTRPWVGGGLDEAIAVAGEVASCDRGDCSVRGHVTTVVRSYAVSLQKNRMKSCQCR